MAGEQELGGGEELDYETEARQLGWVPEEEFKGNKAHWVDAEEFVQRGQTIMPLLKQNNKRLQTSLLHATQKIDTLEAKLQNATTAIEKIEKHYTEANKRAVETAKAQLKEELKQARADNDVDAELEIQERISQLNATPSEPAATVKNDPPTNTNTGYTPEFQQWLSENKWFGEDKKKTKLVTRIAEDLREEGSELQGVDFFNEAVRLYEEQYGEEEPEERKAPARRPASKVEGSTPRGRSGGGKSFADLPLEAKQACWSDVEDLVGPDKRYKDKASWEKAYAKIYYGEE